MIIVINLHILHSPSNGIRDVIQISDGFVLLTNGLIEKIKTLRKSVKKFVYTTDKELKL